MLGFIIFRIIYDKIDKDADGFVTEEELQSWIQHVQNKYMMEDTERQWQDHQMEGDVLEWNQYKQRTYGFMNDGKRGLLLQISYIIIANFYCAAIFKHGPKVSRHA